MTEIKMDQSTKEKLEQEKMNEYFSKERREKSAQGYRNELKIYNDEWKNKNYNDLFKNDKITFGKHKGKTWSDLYCLYNDYFNWLIQNNIIKNPKIMDCCKLRLKIKFTDDMVSYVSRGNDD